MTNNDLHFLLAFVEHEATMRAQSGDPTSNYERSAMRAVELVKSLLPQRDISPVSVNCPACDCQWPARKTCKVCNGMGEVPKPTQAPL
jgi:hypothetical protein